MSKQQRLWEKGEKLNQQVHAFTVGNDPQIDLELFESDIFGSAAHARMLQKVGILNQTELDSLLSALTQIREDNRKGLVTIPQELEDCHTTLESLLVEKCGDAGRRVHTARSRNDQILLVMRLYLREKTLETMAQLSQLANVFFERARDNFTQPMPGYTHFQPAMPTTVGIWLHAFGESCIDSLEQGFRLLENLDSNPLGAGSGFGSTFSIDRALVASLLGFSKVQRNSIEVQNSRGRFEKRAAAWLTDISSFIEKIAQDLILFSTREYGFLSIPPEFTTGSSIMPQKQNPDVLELLRARAGKLRAAEMEVQFITSKLPSHYHRDFQYTKEPIVRAFQNIQEMLPVLEQVLRGLTFHGERLNAAMTPDLFATYDAFLEVKAGLPFRDAYKKTAERVKTNSFDMEVLKKEFRFVIEDAQKDFADGEKILVSLQQALQTQTKRVADLMNGVLAKK